ncbi:unnamed protein product [Brassica napus]|uniref:(rape) hypothetical protein n=1 Tax=Brassica napus TaxID=3708 RepID=A0A816YY38_BRANA|nr:unnamed protein product [Brassica napus]
MANRSMRDKQQSHENPTQNQRNLRNPPSETPNPHGANCPGAFPEPNLRSEPRSLRFNPFWTLNLHDNLFDFVHKKLTSRTTLSLPGR